MAIRTNSVKQLVLCVDDDHAALSLSKLALELEGYSVVTATSGSVALDTFSRQPVDAVVLDYEMPGMDGAELAKQMKHLKPRVPKLLFTSSPDIARSCSDVVEGSCDKLGGFVALGGQVHSLLKRSNL